MRNDERIKYEESIGFKSFATISNEVYDRFDFVNAKSVDEIKAYVATNNQYVALEELASVAWKSGKLCA